MNTLQAIKMLRDALAHAESVYRLNVVKDGEPSSTLQNMQSVLAATANVEALIALDWTPASHLPDADTTVILALADGEVWQGYWDGGDWIEVSGLRLAPDRVKYWQHTPKHPEDRA